MKTQQNSKFPRVFCIVVIALIVCVGYQYLVKSCNDIFPINPQEVLAIQVAEYDSGQYSTKVVGGLSGNKVGESIDEINALQPIGDSTRIEHTTTWLNDYHIIYEVTVRYHPELSRLRRESATHIYFAENGVIIADCGGYTKYQTNSENYDDFLLLLEEYAKECFISVY